MFGGKDDKNKKVREQLEHGGGQRAWAVILDYKSRYQTGRYAFASHWPRKGGSIGVIFDPRDHSRLAICPEWAFSPESAGRPRTQEMIAVFLGHQPTTPDAKPSPGSAPPSP